MTDWENIKSQTQNIKSKDPKIKTIGYSLVLESYYFSSRLVSSYLLLLVCFYSFFLTKETIFNLIFGFLSIATIILIVFDFKYTNTITTDLINKKLSIQSNWLIKHFRETKNLGFSEITKVKVESNELSSGFWSTNRRFYIVLVLKDETKLKIISSNKEYTAKRIAVTLSHIIL